MGIDWPANDRRLQAAHSDVRPTRFTHAMTAAFRDARPSDIELALVMMRELYASDGMTYEPRSRRAVLQLMSEPRAGRVRMIEVDGLPGGLFGTYVWVPLGVWRVVWIARRAFRGRAFSRGRLGNRGARHAGSECAGQGMSALLLEADFANEKATRLYRRLGFREHSRRLMMLPVSAIASSRLP
jgi:hypothetical protein